MNKPDGERLRVLWGSFAEAFQAEATDLAIQYRRFSIPQFMHYVITQPREISMQVNLSILNPSSGCASGVAPTDLPVEVHPAVEGRCTGGPGTAKDDDQDYN